MFSNVALDVFIGLVFVFLLYSLLATILQEIIATRFAFRAKVLEKAILRMLEDGKTTAAVPYMDRIEGILHLFNLKSAMKGKKVAPWFYAHPLIKYLAEDNWYSKPAYISDANFSKVIVDLLKGIDTPGSESLQAIHQAVTRGFIHKIPFQNPDLANPAVKHLNSMNELDGNETVPMSNSTRMFLLSLWQDSGADMIAFETKLQEWFNDTMERATGWFKKYVRIVLFVLGLILAIVFNVDSLAIRRTLTNNRTAREQMVSLAIASQDRLDPAKLSPEDNNLLDSTYKLVAHDAQEANNILGLGRPWKDTVNRWKDSMKSPGFPERFSALRQQADEIRDGVRKIGSSLVQSEYELKRNLQREAALKNLKDSNSMAEFIQLAERSVLLRNFIQRDRDSLAKISGPLIKYNEMKELHDRSEYIKQAVGDRWFVYSPNQAGGWETLFGWIITALAVMLGAPFWFDLLSKLISLRGTGTKISATDGTSTTPEAVAPSNTSLSSSSNNTNADPEAVG